MLNRHASSFSTSLIALGKRAVRPPRRGPAVPAVFPVSSPPRFSSSTTTSTTRTNMNTRYRLLSTSTAASVRRDGADLTKKRTESGSGVEPADLGLRSRNPPDSIPDPAFDTQGRPNTPPKRPTEIPDNEWELRTGRAIDIIQETLPSFFTTGLVTAVDKSSGAPRPPTSSLVPTINSNFLEYYIPDQDSNEEPIYSPSIRFSYTPPVALPSPFPETFHIDGVQLYLASAGFVRHTMNALYTDLSVTLAKMSVNTPKGPPKVSLPTSSSPSDQAPPSTSSPGTKRVNREKSLFVRQIISGKARVSGNPGEWEVESTYTFSPVSGLISNHTINSIHPAPHQAVYDSIRFSFGKFLGPGWEGGVNGGSTAAVAAGSGNAPEAAYQGKFVGSKG